MNKSLEEATHYFLPGNKRFRKAGRRSLRLDTSRASDCLGLDSLFLGGFGVDVNGSRNSKLATWSRFGSELCTGGGVSALGIGRTCCKFCTWSRGIS